jgi:hypothetical protein
MKRLRFSIRTVFIMVAIVACASFLVSLAIPPIRVAFNLTAGDYAFDSISVGDNEAKLIDTLKSTGVKYSRAIEGDKTVYSHEGGFLRLYIYTAKNGRVVEMAMD